MSTWIHQAAHEGLSFGFVLPHLPHPSSSSQLTPNPTVVPALCPLPALPSQAAKPDLNQGSSCLLPLSSIFVHPCLHFLHFYPSLAATAADMADSPSGLGQEPERSSSSCEWGFSLHSSSWPPHVWRRKPGRHPGMFG